MLIVLYWSSRIPDKLEIVINRLVVIRHVEVLEAFRLRRKGMIWNWEPEPRSWPLVSGRSGVRGHRKRLEIVVHAGIAVCLGLQSSVPLPNQLEMYMNFIFHILFDCMFRIHFIPA